MSEANELTEMELNLAYELEKRFCSWSTAKLCARFAVDYVLHKAMTPEPREWYAYVTNDGKLRGRTDLADGSRTLREIKVREVTE